MQFMGPFSRAYADVSAAGGETPVSTRAQQRQAMEREDKLIAQSRQDNLFQQAFQNYLQRKMLTMKYADTASQAISAAADVASKFAAFA